MVHSLCEPIAMVADCCFVSLTRTHITGMISPSIIPMLYYSTQIVPVYLVGSTAKRLIKAHQICHLQFMLY